MAYPEIRLNTPIVIQPQITGSDVIVIKIEERPVNKMVSVEIAINGRPQIITAWSGAEYDAIGQWTDTDLEARIKQILEQQ